MIPACTDFSRNMADGALGVTLRAFDSLEAYQREVLQVES